MINHVTIFGTGQVGTSIALALTQNAPHLKLTLHDCDVAAPDLVRQRFLELGIASDALCFATTPESAVQKSDLVILAPPVNVMGDLTQRILPALSPTVILTDTGSTKVEAIKTITAKLSGTGISYVPAHPGNGSQGSGPLTGSPGNILGANSWMFIIEDPEISDADFPAQKILRDFWQDAQVQVATTDAETHDNFFGTCSHFQHLAVFTYLNISRHEIDMKADFMTAGTAFRNLTRVAISKTTPGAASPLVSMWRPIFEQNRPRILAAASNFQDHLQNLIEAVERGDHGRLRNLLAEAQAFRSSITDHEPRENLRGEILDIKTAAGVEARNPFNMAAREKATNTLMIPLAIAYAQTMNARDVDAELVSGKANPSFRDGTALALNDPDEAATFLLENQEDFLYIVSIFKGDLAISAEALRDGNWTQIEEDILNAQSVRTPLAGPRKGADTRPEYLLPKFA